MFPKLARLTSCLEKPQETLDSAMTALPVLVYVVWRHVVHVVVHP